MSKLVFSNLDESRPKSSQWELRDDCLKTNKGRYALRDLSAAKVEYEGKILGYRLYVKQYNNIDLKFPIYCHDKKKLEKVADYINKSNAAPTDIPEPSKEKVESLAKEASNKNTVLGIVAIIVFVLIIGFFVVNCSGHKSSSKNDWDNLTSHQQEVAREAHDYKEALDKQNK